ncbi:MAG: prefoldin subunit alpha [Candidatus Aenigmatarchaeota archaeon]|nr:prefoldin subunit alpha [Candidatus Aenigmarchaeota archaeon]
MVSLKEAQEKISRYQVLGEKLKMYDNRRQLLAARLAEVDMCKSTLDEIENDKETIIPIGGGVFIKAIVKDVDKMIYMISRDTGVEMDRQKVKENIQKNKKTLEEALGMIENDMMKIQEEMMKLEPEIRSFIEKQQSG